MKKLLFLPFFLFPLFAHAQVVCTKGDSAQVVKLVVEAPNTADLYYFTKRFLGLPYVGHTLEVSDDKEPLVVNLRQLDCTTLIDTALGLYLTWKKKPKANMAFAVFKKELESVRYFHGKRNGYVSRLHYFSQNWHDNVSRGNYHEVPIPESLTVPLTVNLHYMTQHPKAYRQLAAHPEYLPTIKAYEQKYSGRDGRYIPKNKLRLAEKYLKNGDIVAIVTKKDGLDYSHLGMVSFHTDGRVHLLNASSLKKKVVDDPQTLEAYLNGQQSALGIRVWRTK